uniref:Integrase catalytic domain-containing protein n=1 Tax=Tanacetum cinerariifolium TaxID=118510 RepID=A0A6L2KSS2_TANCI|nr:hypothetical protein [Tanacetum cinerariifolium]
MAWGTCPIFDFEKLNGGYATFGGNPKGGKISGKGKVKTRKLDFDDVYFVKELKFNLFSVSQMCDKKNNVLFTDTECLVLSHEFKLPDENQVLFRVPRENNMYNVDLKNIVLSSALTCLFSNATLDESNLWHRRLGHINFKTMNKLGKQHRPSCKTKPVSSVSHPLQRLHMDLFGPTFVKSLNKKSYCLVVTDDYSRFTWVFFLATKDETSPILKTFLTGNKNQLGLKVKIIRSDNGTELKNNDLSQFYGMKGIKREFSVPRTPQQNGIAERKNKTLIEAARTMLADSLLPISFLAEVVNTACYVQNRVLVTKPQNKTPYELLLGRTPSIGFMRPFGYPVTILNTLDPLGKFNGKVDEGFLVGYSISSKAFRVFNSRTQIIQETLHINFLENKPNDVGSGPTWMFDIDTLTKTMNYQLVIAGNQSNPSAGVQEQFDPKKAEEESVPQYVLFPVWSSGSTNPHNTDDDAAFGGKKPEFEGRKPKSEVHVSPSSSAQTKKHDDKTKREAKGKSHVESLTGYKNFSAEFKNFSDNSINEVNAVDSPVPAVGQILTNNTNTFSAAGPSNDVVSPTHGKSSYVQYLDDPNMPELEDITYSDVEEDVGVEADFTNLETFITVSPIPTTKVHKDHPVTQIIGDLSLATQTRGMKKVAKDQGGLSQMNNDDFHTCKFAYFLSQEEPKRVHQALKDPSWIEAMQEELLQFKMNRKDERGIVVMNKARLVTQGHTQEEGIDYEEVFAPIVRIEAIRLFLAYASFMGFMVYQMEVKSSFLYGTIKEEVYVCQPLGFEDPDYPVKVYKVIKALYGLHQAPRAWKFGLTDGKSASTPIDTEKPLLEDPDGEDVDVHTYRSMIGSLMYLTSSRPDIMFVVCACARFQVTPEASHLYAVKRVFRYLKGKPHLGLWYLKDSPFNLVAYSDSDYAGASQDRKSTTGECQFFGYRLILWQCKKQTVMVTSSTEAELNVTAVSSKFLMFESIDCLPNEEIFTELSRMGYEKPFTKLTFYKAFFSPQLKFLIHTILQCMSEKKTSWNEFSSSMASAVIFLSTGRKFNFSKYIFDSLVRNVDNSTKFYMYLRFLQLIIRAQVGDFSLHSIKYSSPALTQKVFANMKRVGKGFLGVDTPLFEGMIVAQQVDESAAKVNVDDVPTIGVVDEGVADVNVVLIAVDEPPIPSPTPPTQPPPSQDQPSTLQDKIAQSLEITKLKQRIKKLERRNMLKWRIITSMDANVDVNLKDVADIAKEVVVDAEIEESADPAELQEVVEVVTTAKLMTEVVTAASATITAVDTLIPAAIIPAAVPILTTAPSAARRRKGVVVRYPEETATPSIIIHSEAKVKDKGKGILDDVIDQVQRKEKEDNAMTRYQALKRKPQTEAQARKNMMIYLRNTAGFKMDYFKGMKYDDIRPIFEKYFNFNVAFLEKIREQMEEENSKPLKRISESQEEKVAKKQKLDEEVEELKRHLQIVPNNEDDVYTEATPLARKMILLVERRYPLSRFTLDQMLNNVRLEVKEESEVSLELLRFDKTAELMLLEQSADVGTRRRNIAKRRYALSFSTDYKPIGLILGL